MNLLSHVAGSVAVLRLAGRFDNYVAPAVSDWLEKNTPLEQPQIVINLANVHFVDSTALATLVQGLNRCRKRNGELYLCGLQQQVFMIFELTRLDKAFQIFVDEDHAIGAFAS
ncbi:MAG TPA: STAS domain-containing protein [Kouleothrix sp.]|uniref:STAS domain-containing protein n=1 Tax=Kouleothrix sp. TaxID=2779161 RepID=UPI002BE26B97|nr:STAS domain-containing protein [Kouleothrix sp.]